MSAPDHELLEAWRGGDRLAGDELFGRYFRSLFAFFAHKVPGNAEDLISRTMMACLQNIDRIQADGSFRGYLFGIARHELFGHYRRLRTEPDLDFSVTSICDLGPTPSRMLVQHKTQKALLAALRALPLELQITIELHYWEGLSTAELSEALGIPRGTVKSRLRRAREAHAERVENHQDAANLSSGELEDWVRSIRQEAAFAVERD